MNKKRYAIIDRTAVDLAAISRLRHQCQPEICRDSLCCCSCYEVYVEREELSPIIGALPEASRFAPHLLDEGDCYNIFDDAGRGSYIIDSDEDSLCVLAFKDPNGLTLCSLHAAALDLALSPREIKPFSCCLWPLAIESGELPILTVQSDAHEFPCNTKRESDPALDEGVAEIIDMLYGQAFRQKVEKAGLRFLG
jgi:hypothetical protein